MGLDKEYIKKNWVWIVFLIILLSGFFVRIYFYSQTADQPLWWDEADYMSYAKRIGNNLDINDVWYYRRTYLMPLVWGGMFALGFNEPGIRFTEVLFGIGLIIFTFLAGKEMFNERIGLIAAAGIAFSRLPIFLGTRFMTNLPATMFLMAGMWLFWKGYVNKKGNHFILLSFLFLGLGLFTRFSFLLSFIPFGVYVFFNERGRFWKNKYLWYGLLIILLMLLPFIIQYNQHIEGGLIGFLKHYTHIGVESPAGEEFMGLSGIPIYLRSILDNIGWIYSILAILGLTLFFNLLCIDKIFKNKEVNKSLFMLIWILFPLFYHGMFSMYAEPRYLLWMYPAVLMLAGVGVMNVYKYFKNYKKLFIVLVVGLIILNSILLLGSTNTLIEGKKTSFLPVKESAIWMKENSEPEDVIISNSIPQTQYYAERTTYMVGNASHLESFNPKYVVTSIFERSPDWYYNYPTEKNLKVVQAFFADAQKTQPILLVFEYR